MASLAFAAAIVAAQAWQPQSGVTAQATATVRIVAGQSVRFDDAGGDRTSQPGPRKTKLEVNGTQVPAVLVEFS
jgi:hypothetical protein